MSDDEGNIQNRKPADANNTLQISSDLIDLMPFKFVKTATTQGKHKFKENINSSFISLLITR